MRIIKFIPVIGLAVAIGHFASGLFGKISNEDIGERERDCIWSYTITMLFLFFFTLLFALGLIPVPDCLSGYFLNSR